jgi:hypothetical protein
LARQRVGDVVGAGLSRSGFTSETETRFLLRIRPKVVTTTSLSSSSAASATVYWLPGPGPVLAGGNPPG